MTHMALFLTHGRFGIRILKYLIKYDLIYICLISMSVCGVHFLHAVFAIKIM